MLRTPSDEEKWDAWTAIRNNTGFGWDTKKGVPTAPLEAWAGRAKVGDRI